MAFLIAWQLAFSFCDGSLANRPVQAKEYQDYQLCADRVYRCVLASKNNPIKLRACWR